jgi:lipid-A-disaccharide synthase
MKKIFIFAGEPSGDLHGDELIKAIKKTNPEVHFIGVGGPKMRSRDIDIIEPMESFQVMGFTAILKHLPRLFRLFYKIRNAILQNKPEAVIFIDYPEFNMLMAKSLRRKGFQGKLIHYICPSVWAWRKNRIKTLVKTLDLLLTILPFEERYFTNTILPVKYVGNPLTINIKKSKKERKFFGLFPGSRISEIMDNLPLQLAAADKIKEKYKFGLSIANEKVRKPIENIIKDVAPDLDIELFEPKNNHLLMQQCHRAIATSGTLTLELALYNIPTAVIYKISRLNYIIAKYIFRINLSHYCLVNIIAGKTLFPEFFGYKISPEHIVQSLQNIESCEQIKHILGEENASDNAAKEILAIL